MSNANELEKVWALPDLSEVATMEPFSAFMVFSGYASGALASRYVDDLKNAMLNEAAAEAMGVVDLVETKPKEPAKPSKVDEGTNTFEIQLERGPDIAPLHAIQIGRIERDIAQRLPARIAPLLPAIRAYTDKRGNDPITAGRLSWLIDTIRQGHKYVTQPKSAGAPGTPLELIYAFMDLWKDLYMGLLDIAGQYGTIAPAPTPTTGTTATQGNADRLKWKSSTAAFVHIFNTLAAGGYFDLPTKGGKGNDPNTAAFARMLLQAFDVPGKDGNPITSEVLRVRLADGAPGQLAEAKAAKFQIPDAGALIVPNAGELE